MWVNNSAIYPSDGFLSFTIVSNITETTGEVASVVTLHDFEERIDKLEKDLRAKADSGDFDGEKGEPGDKGDPGKDATNNDPNAVHVSGNQAISGVKNFIDTPTINGNKVLDDSLQIGGRNLLLGTANSKTMTGDGTHQVTADKAYLFFDKDYVRGKQMMLSVDVTKTEGTTGGTISVVIGRTWQWIGKINVADIPVNTTKRLIIPVTVRDEENRGDVYFQTPDKLLDGSVTLSHVMMVEGTKPTDWTPAPEDIGTSQPIMSGNYGLRVTSDGFQKTTDGGTTWTTANI